MEYGCPNDKGYAIVKGDKIYRITFSLSVAKHILTKLEQGYEIQRVTLKIGKKLKMGEKSRSGAYAIINTSKDWILRVSLYKDVAELFCDYDSRYLAECWITGQRQRVA